MSVAPSDAGRFRLTSDEVHVWCAGLDVSIETCARLSATLGPEELSRSERFRSDLDRRRYIVSHGIVRELLAGYLEVSPGSIRYAYNAFGKPGLGPGFGSPLGFNLSHSGGLALVAVAAGWSVGVDVEYLRAQPDCVEIAQCFFPAADVDRLMRLPGRLRPPAFFSCWTKTEAYAKARGGGLADAGEGPDVEGPARRWSLYPLRPAPGYVGALAVEGSGLRLDQRRWRMTGDAFM